MRVRVLLGCGGWVGVRWWAAGRLFIAHASPGSWAPCLHCVSLRPTLPHRLSLCLLIHRCRQAERAGQPGAGQVWAQRRQLQGGAGPRHRLLLHPLPAVGMGPCPAAAATPKPKQRPPAGCAGSAPTPAVALREAPFLRQLRLALPLLPPASLPPRPPAPAPGASRCEAESQQRRAARRAGGSSCGQRCSGGQKPCLSPTHLIWLHAPVRLQFDFT